MSEPKLLIASPSMADPFFEKSVVLVWHYDEEGAIGVIINRPLSEARERGVMPQSPALHFPDVLLLDPSVDLSPYADREVNWGGPVDLERGTILAVGWHRRETRAGVGPALFGVTGSKISGIDGIPSVTSSRSQPQTACHHDAPTHCRARGCAWPRAHR